MSVVDYLADHQLPLYGSSISEADGKQLLSKLHQGIALETYVALLQSFPLCGVSFALSEDHDLSGFGAEVQMMNTTQMLSEAFDAYPGIVVTKLGYIPVGMCLLGSGDYYYLNAKAGDPSNPPLVRVPHDAMTSATTYAEEQIEVVCCSFTDFLGAATIDAPAA
ncbi:hypothetical protein [Rhizobium alvei]|uniref:SMI1/KNR4 family protein n=1 Tax=Rhizobium alvei TaxID=1132659 RepID=A0ABT8YIJ5_9HYPH|nr:hypothetical protein [Rhizobium alvei]MDO6963381.1 hypothetical protein [Rhizobium alvei]